MPRQLRAFDYSMMTDVILHIRYTAREAGDPLGLAATNELVAMLDGQGQGQGQNPAPQPSGQALMFCLRYDFPTEWAAFVNSATDDFTVMLNRHLFP